MHRSHQVFANALPATEGQYEQRSFGGILPGDWYQADSVSTNYAVAIVYRS